MRHRKVRDVMTTDVVTVPADMSLKELAALLAQHEISSQPVLGPGGRVAGVVSEVDLLRKEEYQEDPDAKRPPGRKSSGGSWTPAETSAGRPSDGLLCGLLPADPGASQDDLDSRGSLCGHGGWGCLADRLSSKWWVVYRSIALQLRFGKRRGRARSCAGEAWQHRVAPRLILTAALLLFVSVSVVFPVVPATAAQRESLASQTLSVAQLPGFLLDDDRALDPVSLLKSQSLYFRFVASRTIEAAHVRRFTAFDGGASVAVRLAAFINHKFAEALPAGTGQRLHASLPPGTIATIRQSAPGWEEAQVQIVKGRVRADIVIQMHADGTTSARAADRIDGLVRHVSRAQYHDIVWAPDLSGADRVSTRPIQVALIVALFLLILVPQAVLALLTFVRDPAARRRARLRQHPVTPLPEPRPGLGRLIDISDAARDRLRRCRWRIAVRTIVALAAIAATSQLPLKQQMLTLAILALVTAGAEAVWSRARRGFPSRGLWGLPAGLLMLAGAAFTLALAAVGGVLLFMYVFQFFVGTLPADAARSFGALLLVVGMILVGLSAVPYTLTRRVSLLFARRALSGDSRDEIFFLRAWDDDYMRMRARRANRHALLERLSFRRWDRFEEIVVAEVSKRGPVRAFAEPGTRLPPLGAVREVHADEDWQPAVEGHIKNSKLVIMTVARTESVVWEMQQIAEQGALHKAVFLFPPLKDEERARREGVLCSVLGLPMSQFSEVRSSGRQVLVVTVPDGRSPTLMVAEVSDDVSYEAALDVATEELLAVGLSPDVAPMRLPALPAGLPLTGRPRGWRPPKPWYRRWYVAVWGVAILLGLLQQTLDHLPGGTSPPPAVPGSVIFSHYDPVTMGYTGKSFVAVDAGRPALITAGLPDGKQHALRLRGTPDGFLAHGSAVYVTFAQSNRLSAFSVDRNRTKHVWSTHLGEVTAGLAATGSDIFVALPASDRVAVLNARTGGRLRYIRVGHAPIGLITSDHHLFVTNANDGTLSAVDLHSLTVTATMPIGIGLRSLVLAGDRILTDDVVRNRIAIINPHTMSLAGFIGEPKIWDTLAANQRMMATVNSKGSGGWPAISFVDLQTGKTLRKVSLPDLPSELMMGRQSLLAALPDRHVIVRIPLP
jgi:CBS domain protein